MKSFRTLAKSPNLAPELAEIARANSLAIVRNELIPVEQISAINALLKVAV